MEYWGQILRAGKNFRPMVTDGRAFLVGVPVSTVEEADKLLEEMKFSLLRLCQEGQAEREEILFLN